MAEEAVPIREYSERVPSPASRCVGGQSQSAEEEEGFYFAVRLRFHHAGEEIQ